MTNLKLATATATATATTVVATMDAQQHDWNSNTSLLITGLGTVAAWPLWRYLLNYLRGIQSARRADVDALRRQVEEGNKTVREVLASSSIQVRDILLSMIAENKATIAGQRKEMDELQEMIKRQSEILNAQSAEIANLRAQVPGRTTRF